MKGIHINWTSPYQLKYYTKKYKQNQYEILVQLLSVLYWKKHYGEIKLYTDKDGLRYYKNCSFPILELYDEVDTNILSKIDSIDPKIFWAGGKLFSIRNETTPFVMLDLDLFLTDNIEKEFDGYDLVFSHYETLNHPVYPNPKDIVYKNSHTIPNYNWGILPGNVCVTYFGNDEFKERYTNEAIQYMSKFANGTNFYKLDNYNARMVFAEQRLLTCIASDMNIKFKPIINDIYNSGVSHVKYNGNDLNSGEEASWFIAGNNSNIGNVPIHHTWGYKHLLVNKGLKLLYVESLHKLIKKDFPEYQQYLGDPTDE